MEIKIIQATPEKRKPKYTDESTLGFGRILTDHMFTLPYGSDRGWHDPVIEPYRAFSLDPAYMSLHYGQLIFEEGSNGDWIYILEEGEVEISKIVDGKKFVIEISEVCGYLADHPKKWHGNA